MTINDEVPRVASASREIAADVGRIFELIVDPKEQPRWDGNNNLAEAPEGQRIRAVGDVFTMTLTIGSVRENHVVEFEEGRLVAWKPSEPGDASTGAPLAMGARADRFVADARHAHVRLVGAHR
jgi:uncharacterized protein YndB with AHSA1/START domain